MTTIQTAPSRRLSRADLTCLLDEVEEIIGDRRTMLTVPEVAKLSALHPNTIRLMCVSGELPASQMRTNAPWRIHVSQLPILRGRAA